MSGNGQGDKGGTRLSEAELRDMKVDELRERAKREGVSATSGMRKDDLVKAISKAYRDGGGRKNTGGGKDGGAKRNDGRMRTGSGTSKSLKYAQEVTSTDQEPERAGRSLVTTSHDVIRQWAQERDAVPATVPGTEHDGRLGVLRFDFGGDSERLEHVEWEQWFETFDERGLNFIYQEETSDGRQSNFFRLENPDREDA